VGNQVRGDSFTEFVEAVEPRLKRAFVAAFGTDTGLDATADALSHGWEHWESVREMDNPAGYLWGVGRNKARKRLRSRPVFPEVPADHVPWVEPGLPMAMASLSESQRAAVLLIHGFEWTHAEVAELLGVSVSTVQKHAERGMAKLRQQIRSEQ
jgi:DNA-directed RNA polymerase specialized sigma24 family protein